MSPRSMSRMSLSGYFVTIRWAFILQSNSNAGWFDWVPCIIFIG